ncbi:MAG TPA: M20/M25/M40 family metallo-hydrolase [Gaiellaceae bacterium]|nr:M20/M25/M40 family metallo-hydrolase [Gaiellaceae bacterium]
MRRTALLLFVLALGALTLAPLSSTAVGTDTTELRDAVTVDGIMAHQQAFQAIADANGDTRASGTPGYDASLVYVKEQLEATGYYDVRVQNFLFDAFRELAPPAFQRISPDPRTFVNPDEFITMDYSETGDVSGTLVATNDIVIPPGATASTSNSGCELADYAPASATEPQVALAQRGTCDFRVKAENAQAAGYDALIVFNEGQEGRQDTLAGTLTSADASTIPVIGTSFAIGEELYNQLQAGAVTVRVATTTEIRRNVPTANLLATTKTGRTDRQVVVGAHLDSVQEGPGINDNGSGTSAILEIALQMAELGVEPTNQVRFAFWGAEESGLIGSQFYVDSLTKRELKNTAVNLNFDMVGSPNYVRFVYDGDASDTASLGSTGSGVVEDVFVDYFDSQGLESEPTAFDGRSDYDAFISVGIPAGGVFSGAEGVKTEEQAEIYGGTAGIAYDPCYHQFCDDIGNLSSDALDEMSDAAAHATLVFAQTGSAVQGTDKGKAQGHLTEFQGSRLHK